MTREDVQTLLDFANRLGSTPRHVLVRAACMAGHEEADAAAQLRLLRQSGVRHCPLASDCANLLLTPVASYAQDNLGTALSLLWQDAPRVDR
jgi:hypothetical protein